MRASREIAGYSEHCLRRMAQRNVSEADVEYIVTRGACEYRTGVLCFTLPRRSIPVDERRDHSSLESLVILMNDGFVITVYRTRRPLHHIRRKAKYHDPRSSAA